MPSSMATSATGFKSRVLSVAYDEGKELARAIEQHRSGRLTRAIGSYQDILRRSPNNPIVLNLLGLTYFQQGDAEKGVSFVSRAMALNPDLPGGHYNLGTMIQKLGRNDEAISQYKRALAINPSDFEACNNLGAALKALKRYDEALECYERSVALKLDYAETYYNLSNLLVATGRDAKTVEKLDRRSRSIRSFPPRGYLPPAKRRSQPCAQSRIDILRKAGAARDFA